MESLSLQDKSKSATRGAIFVSIRIPASCLYNLLPNEPRHEKTNVLHMGKQRRRSALRETRS